MSFLSRKLLSLPHIRIENCRAMGWAAVCQMTVTNQVKENYEQAKKLIESAAGKGAEMVFLPEAFDFIGTNSQETRQLAEDLQGNTITNFRELAVKNKVWLSLGGFHLKSNDSDEKLSNCHVIISSSGDLVSTYNKAHLFDVEIPGKFRLKVIWKHEQPQCMTKALTFPCLLHIFIVMGRVYHPKERLKYLPEDVSAALAHESDCVNRGEKICDPIDTPIGKLGLSICYDLRFPELSLSLRKQGAEILTFPSAFTVPTGMAHWKPLLQARAIESQCYVIAAAQTGKHNDKRSSYGHAMIVDPWGAVVTECREGINFALAEIDLDYLNKIRREMPVMEQRRKDLYGNIQSVNTEQIEPIPADDWIFKFGPATVYGHSVVHRTNSSLLFVNKKPVVPGHSLVAPLRGVERLTDLSTEETYDLFNLVKQTEKMLMKKYNTNSCTISIQDGPLAGQSIPHLHVHLLPRKENDFNRNDDIYSELEKHDKVETGWRDEQTMAQEAKEFRKSWKQTFG